MQRDSKASWWKDPWLWAAIAVGLALRVLPILLWETGDCVRDECIYRTRAADILDGRGLTVTDKGWLPAPGYPYLLALLKTLFGAFYAVKGLQVALAAVSQVVVYLLGARLEGRRVARWSAWLFALHPTLAWYSTTMWIESIYVTLLLGACLGLLWAREGGPARGLLCGVLLGAMVLFRGVATYIPPIFVLAMIWPDGGGSVWRGLLAGARARWRHALVMCVAVVATVAPWSIHASQRYGGPMISDATAGHVLFLGNNDFPPLTFDYGNGMLTGTLYGKYLRTGRRPCLRNVPPVQSDRCEVRAARDHILENPGQFVERIPMRLGQLLNPNSFLTRHIRWGYWAGLPFAVKEGIALWVMLTSLLVTVGGTVAAFARARGPYGVLSVGVVLYTCATIAVSYGMTRFRLPLEALWIPYLAIGLAYPREVLRSLTEDASRAGPLLIVLPPLLALTAWYLPTGFPWLW